MSKKGINFVLGLALIFMSTDLGAARASNKVFTIGIITYVSIFTPVIEGFEAGMAEQDYIEDLNIKYMYNGGTDSAEDLSGDKAG